MSIKGKKAVIRAIAIGVAAFVEQAMMELIERLLDWAKSYRSRGS